ncbi:MAG: RagB/SusD family nutrient uptake outer membrane protein, partial [Bacteroidota bacterium]|nr:RagB/SusD family nutrient uptake outer membrane protein [Bacteroidota bacterium]
MKKQLFYLMLACMFTACTKLDLTPTNKYAQNIIWENITNVDSYVRSLYSTSFSLYAEIKTSGSNTSDGYTDIIKYTLTGADANSHNRIQSGATKIAPNNMGSYLSPWSSTYTYIKNCNEFLINVKKYGGALDTAQLKIRIAEVRFIRAFLYHKLAIRHGGVVLRISEDQLDGPPEKNKARSTTSQTWDFVISELERAAKDLPVTWNSSNLGRITKGAAYGMIARSALYAGRWDKAISAVGSVEAIAASGVYNFASLADLFTAPKANNSELMIYYNYAKPDYVQDWDSQIMPGGDAPGSGANITPTNELVDLYDIKVNGVWQKFDWNNLALYNNKPYENRDPRFYATVLYNGEAWKGRNIESFVGGKDGFEPFISGQTDKYTSTGYYTRKFG